MRRHPLPRRERKGVFTCGVIRNRSASSSNANAERGWAFSASKTTGARSGPSFDANAERDSPLPTASMKSANGGTPTPVARRIPAAKRRARRRPRQGAWVNKTSRSRKRAGAFALRPEEDALAVRELTNVKASRSSPRAPARNAPLARHLPQARR